MLRERKLREKRGQPKVTRAKKTGIGRKKIASIFLISWVRDFLGAGAEGGEVSRQNSRRREMAFLRRRGLRVVLLEGRTDR